MFHISFIVVFVGSAQMFADLAVRIEVIFTLKFDAAVVIVPAVYIVLIAVCTVIIFIDRDRFVDKQFFSETLLNQRKIVYLVLFVIIRFFIKVFI